MHSYAKDGGKSHSRQGRRIAVQDGCYDCMSSSWKNILKAPITDGASPAQPLVARSDTLTESSCLHGDSLTAHFGQPHSGDKGDGLRW
jgi:hypothetical protein